MPSASVLEKKKEIVSQLSEEIRNAKTIVFVDHRGLTVEQDTELRNALRKAEVHYKVVKNTLTRFAAKENNLSELDSYFNGPTAMALSNDDLVAPAKVMHEYASKFENLDIKVGVLEGEIIDVNKIKALASLPSKEELVAKVLGGLNAPITGLVNVLNANIRGLVIALKAIADQKA